MANIYEQIEAYENAIYLNLAGFIKRLSGLPVFVMDKPFIAPTDPYFGIRIISSDGSGGWGQRLSFADNAQSYLMDNTYKIEITAVGGRPMTMMTYILAALRSAEELKYQYLYSKGMGFLSASNIAQAHTVLDGDKTSPRARMITTFNTSLLIEDLPTTPVEAINITINANSDYFGLDKLQKQFEQEYGTDQE